MPKFILEINLIPGEVYGSDDVATTLRLLSNHLNIVNTREMYIKDHIRDINGNVVGHYEVV